MIDGPSFCWHCFGDLERQGEGHVFDLVQDPLGWLHRVHKTCAPDAVGDGTHQLLPAQAKQ